MRRIRKHHNVKCLSIIILLLFLYNTAAIDLFYQKELKIDPSHTNNLLRAPLKFGVSNSSNRGSGYRPEPSTAKEGMAWQVLEHVNIEKDYYPPDRKLFDLPYEISPLRINAIDVIEEAIEKALVRASRYMFFNFDPGQVIIEIGGSASYLRNPDGTIFWPGVRQVDGKPELDVLVFLPEEWCGNSVRYTVLSCFLHLAVRRNFKSVGNPVFLDIRVKKVGALMHSEPSGTPDKILGRLTNYLVNPYLGIPKDILKVCTNIAKDVIKGRERGFFISHPYLSSRLYFGKEKTLQTMLQGIKENRDKHSYMALKEYYLLFVGAKNRYDEQTTLKTRLKSAKSLLQLSLMRGDQDDALALSELIKDHVIEKRGDFTKLDSFFERAHPGFLPEDIEGLVGQYNDYQMIYGALHTKSPIAKDREAETGFVNLIPNFKMSKVIEEDEPIRRHLRFNLLGHEDDQTELPELHIYSIKVPDKGHVLRGLHIKEELRNRKLLRPLLTSFFCVFQDVERIHEGMAFPHVLALLIEEYGFGPEQEKAEYNAFIGRRKSIKDKGTIYFINEKTSLFFEENATAEVRQQFKIVDSYEEIEGKPRPIYLGMPLVLKDRKKFEIILEVWSKLSETDKILFPIKGRSDL
ncbi:MAG: hypothetical protein ACYSSI_05055 [Planctomycetota bacterium]|jgi:hypothetical protein